MIRTPHTLQTTRRIDALPSTGVRVVDVIEGPFRGEVIPPAGGAEISEDESPREGTTYLAQWPAGIIGPGSRAPLRPAERFESDQREYELLGFPRQLVSGRRPVGVEAVVMPIDLLYPYTAELQDQGGQQVVGAVPIAVWNSAALRTDQGQYSTYDAELPPEFYGEIMVKNRQIVLRGVAYRIIDPYFMIQGPRCRATLRGVK